MTVIIDTKGKKKKKKYMGHNFIGYNICLVILPLISTKCKSKISKSILKLIFINSFPNN